MTNNWLKGLRMAVLAPLVVALSSCGGGGEGDEVSEVPGLVTIEEPTESSSYTTGSETVRLSGSRSDNVNAVNWSNAAGGSGGASLSSQECNFFSAGPIPCNHEWDASIPLVVGANVITVTGSASNGHWGRDTITVVRAPESIRPTVSSTSPLPGATDVAANTSVTANFSEEMSPQSVTTAAFLLRDSNNNPVSGTVTYSNGSLTFTPVGLLTGSTSYTATIAAGLAGAKDLAGNALALPYVWTFRTNSVADTTSPTLTSTSPADGDSCAPVDTAITADFSESISGTQVNSGVLTVVGSGNMQVSGSVYLSNFSRLVFKPASPLDSSSSYAATLTTAIKDASGNPMAANLYWAFATGQGVGAWQPISTMSAPKARPNHTAVWTGAEMIIWGNRPYDLEPQLGVRYNPTTDTWMAVTNAGAPSAREGHVAVWTGREMIIWGGNSLGSSEEHRNDGARYDPVTDTWSPVSSVGAPTASRAAKAVWTGTEMLVFGGYASSGSDARYNPAMDSWAPISAVGAPVGRNANSAIWTGSRMIVWGGSPGLSCTASGGCSSAGGAYDPATNAWESISLAGAPSARRGHSAVWTGSEMAVWGGVDESQGYPNYLYFNDGGLYNPQTKTWRPMSMSCSASARAGHTAIWSGSEMILWGGNNRDGFLPMGSRYDPVADAWKQVSIANVPTTSDFHTAVWAGASMIVWRAGYFGAPMGIRYQP